MLLDRGDADMSQDYSGEHMCPKYECAMNVLGKRWTGLIIHVLLRGTVRFKDIREMVPHMSDKMLSERLKELEELEILERKVYPEIPVRIEYELTKKGKALRPVIDSIHEWGQNWM